MKLIGYAPKAIVSLIRSYTLEDPPAYGLDNTYMYYTAGFTESHGYGNDQINSYLGSSSNFVKYVEDHFSEFFNDTLYPQMAGYEMNNDYEYVGRGALIGVTIQRIVELASTVRKIDFDDDESFFSVQTVNTLRECIFIIYIF